MERVISKDGTSIAYDKTGKGPAVILVDGAFCSRNFGPMKQLSLLLSKNFTVFTYDRRARGDSGDTKPYSVAREIEDIDALINVAGALPLYLESLREQFYASRLRPVTSLFKNSLY
jgi:Predicted hydrolases or acyltransferases (alpha/beta hydrolase superfamily)